MGVAGFMGGRGENPGGSWKEKGLRMCEANRGCRGELKRGNPSERRKTTPISPTVNTGAIRKESEHEGEKESKKGGGKDAGASGSS